MKQTDLGAVANPLLQLLELSRRARQAGGTAELAFLLVNDSRRLCAYRQAALWFIDGGIEALSGVVEPESNAPYAQWLDRVCRFLSETYDGPAMIEALHLPAELASEWAEWLPPHGLWLPFVPPAESGGAGGLLLAGELPWSESVQALLREWGAAWHHAWMARQGSSNWSRRLMLRAIRDAFAPEADAPVWKQRRFRLWAVIIAALFFPVRLSVLAPGELVPANPAVIRAPMDGVVGQFQVQPNDVVKAGQPLFTFDEATIGTRQEVAAQTLATAQAEYRQYAQQAVTDAKAKAQLATLLGKIEEKRAEADYFKDQVERSRVAAPQDGIVLFDDPSEWIGKPVQTGERIMRIALPGDVEVEAWLPVGDAIPLPQEAEVSLYLAASPLSSLDARVRYIAHDATPRPDGTYAYRVRARLDVATHQRVGLKGTAKLRGGWVPFGYWILRRPWATIRQTLGL